MMERMKARRIAGEPPPPNGVTELLWWMAEVGRLVDDPEALGQAWKIRQALDRRIAEAAVRLNEEGHGWRKLGPQIGMTDLGAAKWVRRTLDGPEPDPRP